MKFRIISLNLWLGGNLFGAILDFLKKKPDILASQEVYNGKNPILNRKYRSFDVLKTELGYNYASFAPTFLENLKLGKIERGNAIFSKFPIISTNITFYDVPYNDNYVAPIKDFSYIPRNLQHVTVRINNKQLNLFNTQGIWGVDGSDTKRRLQMGQTIINRVRNKENVILLGDFNLDPNTKIVANIEKYLKNVFKNELTTTFNMKRKDKPGYAKAVVDMIFVSKNIKVIEHYCPQVDISDHLPLVCVLEI